MGQLIKNLKGEHTGKSLGKEVLLKKRSQFNENQSPEAESGGNSRNVMQSYTSQWSGGKLLFRGISVTFFAESTLLWGFT
jgi:hypothetical protein